MHGPDRSVERISPAQFRPPFCPRPGCRAQRPDARKPFRYHRHGVYIRPGDRRTVPRFRCLLCRATFSQQTFSVTYYLKRPCLLEPIAAGLVAGSAHRQLARSLDCAPSSVTRLSARLGRHAMLLHHHLMQSLDAVREPVVYDDFESFAYSQDRPFGLGTAVGQDSWFIYGLQCSPHRRGGRRKASRKTVQPDPEADSGSYRRAFRQTVDLLLAKRTDGDSLELISDGHLGYRRGLRGHPAHRAVRHHVFPNPRIRRENGRRTAEAAMRDEALFATDLLHMLIRHSQAHHRRETIAFGRRHNALMERAFLLAVWRNLVKRRSERLADAPTPAMCLGLTHRPWSWVRVLSRRRFVTRVGLPDCWMKLYRRELVTRDIGPNTRHRRVHAD